MTELKGMKNTLSICIYTLSNMMKYEEKILLDITISEIKSIIDFSVIHSFF